MFAPNQRVKVNLSQMTIQGVFFSQNVQEALGTILEQTSNALVAFDLRVHPFDGPDDRGLEGLPR